MRIFILFVLLLFFITRGISLVQTVTLATHSLKESRPAFGTPRCCEIFVTLPRYSHSQDFKKNGKSAGNTQELLFGVMLVFCSLASLARVCVVGYC